MCRESGSAHSHNACLPDLVDDLLFGQAGDILDLLILHLCVIAVVLDDNGIHHISDSRSSRLYRLDRTGDRTVDRCGDKPARLCNLLSFLHGVAYSHNRNRRRSDVL